MPTLRDPEVETSHDPVPLKGITLSRPLGILPKECSLATNSELFVRAGENPLPVDHLCQPLPIHAQPFERIESLRPALRFRVPLGDSAHELEVLRYKSRVTVDID